MANQDYYNRYGMGKVEETDVRSNLNIAAGTASMAAQGAQAGAQFGGVPGAIIGTAAGGTMGLIAGLEGKADEQIMAAADRSRNAGIDNLTGRDFRTQRVTPDQLEKGMNTGKYMMAEIEGGKYEKGIGEIVVDKNFNEKYDASGDPTHEEGGKDVMLQEGDTVFNTQNSKEKYRKIKNALRRYKMNNDEKALAYLKKERDALPTDEDYDAAEQEQETMMARYGMRTYEDGVNNAMGQNAAIPDDMKYTPPEDISVEDPRRLIGPNVPGIDKILNPNRYDDLEADDTSYMEEPAEEGLSGDALFDIVSDLRQSVNKKELSIKEWNTLLDENLPNIPGLKKDVFNYMKSHGKKIGTYNNPATGFGTNSTDAANEMWKLKPEKVKGMSPENITPLIGGSVKTLPTPQVKMRKMETMMDHIEEAPGVEKGEKLRNFTDPLKYASVATNALMGMQPAEEVTRRYASADEYDYRDTSAAKRRSTMEARNAQNRMLRGRVDRSGSIGTNAQVQAQYMGQMEGINEAESAKQLATDQANTQLRNQVAQQNVKYDIGYDEIDAQNRAARQEFKGTAAAEAAELAQYNEQRRYMKELDKRQYARDQDILDKGLLQSSDFEWASDGTIRYTGSSYKPTTENPYTRESRTRRRMEDGIHVTKKKSNKIKPGGYRMLPDGTIIID